MKHPNLVIRLYQSDRLVREYPISDGQIITVGRKGQKVTIPLSDPHVSRTHASFMFVESQLVLSDSGSNNGSYVNDKRVNKGIHFLKAGDHVYFGSKEIYHVRIRNGQEIAQDKSDASSDTNQPVLTLSQLLKQKNEVIIGREGDLRIEDEKKYISRKHAIVKKQADGKLTIEDQSLNGGTFVNTRRIPKGVAVSISAEDTIFIGLHAIKVNDEIRDLSNEPAILALNISKTYSKKGRPAIKALDQMDVEVGCQEFIALMGPSGCGKSTLLKVLNNSISPSTGKVYIHGLELSQNFELLKRKIGYVPQDDIIHKELTVYKTLYYAAKLRMGDEVDEATIGQKIDEVLGNLNIDRPELRQARVSDLSGGQRKRVSIAVELLNDPSILFLDEPTSPLDPETIKDFLTCIRELTQKGIGTTVVMVTHKPDDLEYVDKVIFLTATGQCAYYGGQGLAMEKYFAVSSIIDIYASLSNKDQTSGTSPEVWGQKWKSLQKKAYEIPKSRPINLHRESYLKQLRWLTTRYLNIKLNDRLNLKLLFAQPVVIAGLISLIFSQLQLGVLFLMAISAIWFGVNNAAKEIVGEQPIYTRERMFNMKLSAYLLSKLLVLSLIAMIQVILFVAILWARYSTDPVSLAYISQYLALGTFLAISATILGLVLSSVSKTVEQAMTIVPIVLIPQIMLAGVVTKIDSVFKEALSYLTLGRWGTEGLARIQDAHPDFEVTRQVFEFDPQQLPPDTLATNQFITYHKSVYNPMPEAHEGNKLWHKEASGELVPFDLNVNTEHLEGALNMLDFYPTNNELLKVAEHSGVWGSIMAISLLNLICICFLIGNMRLKDRN